MTGYWALGERAVRRHSRSGWPGVYVLADTHGIPRYIGRSDIDVRGRLQQHVDAGNYRFFLVEHYRTPDEAYQREANLYHYYRNQLDNAIHPAVPRGCHDGCPRCSYGH